jgi:hypothetical protein
MSVSTIPALRNAAMSAALLDAGSRVRAMHLEDVGHFAALLFQLAVDLAQVGLRGRVHVAFELAFGQQPLSEALDWHVAQRIEVVEHDAEVVP